jgi:hypothetical protein
MTEERRVIKAFWMAAETIFPKGTKGRFKGKPDFTQPETHMAVTIWIPIDEWNAINAAGGSVLPSKNDQTVLYEVSAPQLPGKPKEPEPVGLFAQDAAS